jgi:hypothetical protein
LWKRLIGQDPETATTKKDGRFQEAGPLSGNQETFAVVFELGRLSLRLSVAPEASEEPWPSLHRSLKDAADELRQRLRALADEVTIARIAFGAVLLIPVSDSAPGHSTLTRFLPGIRLDAESSVDFLYRINRPRNAKAIGGLRINRLTTWSLISTMLVPIGSGDVRPLSLASACRLELDISTDHARTAPLPTKELEGIWDELVAHGEDIAARGDVP